MSRKSKTWVCCTLTVSVVCFQTVLTLYTFLFQTYNCFRWGKMVSALSLKSFCVCSHAHVADLMAPIKQSGYHMQYVSDWALCFSKCVFFFNEIWIAQYKKCTLMPCYVLLVSFLIFFISFKTDENSSRERGGKIGNLLLYLCICPEAPSPFCLGFSIPAVTSLCSPLHLELLLSLLRYDILGIPAAFFGCVLFPT